MEEMKNLLPLKYIGYAVVCEEVPDEISIAFNISGCQHRCPDCHSKYLWEYNGEYLKNDLQKIISNYDGLITCVCFLGGDQNINELSELCMIAKENNLKTCIYSGEDYVGSFNDLINNNLIDYLKIGKYISICGSLNSPNTNQKMYLIENKILKDITYRFQKPIERIT